MRFAHALVAQQHGARARQLEHDLVGHLVAERLVDEPAAAEVDQDRVARVVLRQRQVVLGLERRSAGPAPGARRSRRVPAARRRARRRGEPEAVARAARVRADRHPVGVPAQEALDQLRSRPGSRRSRAAPHALRRPRRPPRDRRRTAASAPACSPAALPRWTTITRCQCSCSAWMSVRYATPKPICPYQRSVTSTPASRTRSTAGSSPSTSSRPSSGSPSGTTERIVSTSGAVHRIPADNAADPPNRSVFSHTTTRSPRSAACAAAARPGLPSAYDDQIVHPPLPVT